MKEYAAHWEQHAQSDPLWAILSQDDKRGQRWPIDDFFITGLTDVDQTFAELEQLNIQPRMGKALDFGCGVGRLSHALATYFDEVTGIDASPTIIRLAEELNFDRDRVRFVLNTRSDLGVLQSNTFDFALSLITLQHIPPDATRRYLGELLRVLRPGGLLVFQLPTHYRPELKGIEDLKPMSAGAYRAGIEIVDAPTTVRAAAEAVVKLVVRNESSIEWRPDPIALLGIETNWLAGDGTWKAAKYAQLDVGNHWLLNDGTQVIADDGRVSLPPRLAPGERVDVELVVRAPGRPGIYRCEVDIVQERVTWFADRGSPTASFEVAVTANHRSQPDERVPHQAPSAARPRWGALVGRLRAGIRRGRFRWRLRRFGVSPRFRDFRKHAPKPTSAPQPYGMFGVARSDVEAVLVASDGRIEYLREDQAAGLVWQSLTYFVRKQPGERI